jgi:hypothetical protein
MRHLTRIRIAALATAFFLGGVTAAGFGIKATHDSGAKPVIAHPRTQVIHETRTRTIHVRPRRSRPSAAPPAAAPQIQSVYRPQTSVIPPPTKVRSRVSPTGGGRESDDGGEHEGRDD